MAAVPDAQQTAVVSAAKEQAAADPRQVACRLLTAAVVRQLQAAAVRLWFRAQPASALGRQESKARADRRPVACRLLTAVVVRQLQAAAVRLWFRAQPAFVPGQERPAKGQAAADRRPVACRLLTAVVVRRLQAAAVRLWFQAQPAFVPGQDQPAKEKAAADRRPVACRSPVASHRAAANRAPECLVEWYSEPVPPLERPTAEAKARARQQRPLQQCRQRQCRHLAMILRQQPETAVLETAVQQLETAVGTPPATELAARLSDSARPDWSP